MQDQTTAAYARARYLLTDRTVADDSPELQKALRQALTAVPGDEELLTLWVARHISSRSPDKLYASLESLSEDIVYSPRFLAGMARAFAEVFQRPDLGFVLLYEALNRANWQDSSSLMMPVLFRMMSLCLSRNVLTDRVEELLLFLQPISQNHMISPEHKLFWAETILQYRIFLQKKKELFPASWQELKDRLMTDICNHLKDYTSEESFYVVFRVLVMNDDHDKILKYLALPEITEKFGKSALWYRFAILAAAIVNDFERTEALLDEGLKLDALELAELYDLGNTCFRQNQFSPALKIYVHLLKKNPEATVLRLMIARLNYLLGKPMEGLAVLVPVNPMPAEGYVILGYLWQKASRDEKSYQCFLQAEKMLSAQQPPRTPDAFFYLSAGLSAYKTGHRTEAVRLLQTAHRLAPRDANICNSLGYVLADYNQNLDQAEKLLAYALKQSRGDNAAVQDSVAWLFYRQNRLQEAVKMMIEVLKKNTPELLTDPEIRQHASEIFQKTGLLKLAEFYRLGK